MRETRAVLDGVGADVVIGFGGYVAVPAYLAARRRIPVVVHEATARAGLANRVGARTAQRVLSAVSDSGLRRAEVVGMPLRASITSLGRVGLRAQAREHFGYAENATVLLVFGGSQGAASLTRAVSAAADGLAAAGISVLHAHGPKNTLDLRSPQPGDPPYVAVPYLDRMDLAYAAADITVRRAGANSVTEVAAVGLPAVFVPLPIGNGEQALNARPVVDAGGGLLGADAAVTPEWVRAHVPALLIDPERLAAMSRAAAGVIPLDADELLADLIEAAAEDPR